MALPIYQHVLEECLKTGVKEFCICPGSRNSPLVNCLNASSQVIKHFWFEERSAAFFALGRARQTQAPVAVVTTSGTAAGELLPAAMEAHYTQDPLLLITADRPRRFRGTGAPQSAEQKGIFGVYARFEQDLEGDEKCHLHTWDYAGPGHLNVCIEDPKSYVASYSDLSLHMHPRQMVNLPIACPANLDLFFQRSKTPLVIVCALAPKDRAAVTEFLLRLQAPVYFESGSGLREEPQLKHLQLSMESAVWRLSKEHGYTIDGVLRLGGIPVTRIWRDLEDRPAELAQCSLSDVPFSGLSWGRHIQCDLRSFLSTYELPKDWACRSFESWRKVDAQKSQHMHLLFEELPTSEPALYHSLSKFIPENSMVYLGNSLPVREWDLAATTDPRNIDVETSRGLNGIDGQISTFLGLCTAERDNWAILGDLTTLYDFAALWMLQSMPQIALKIAVINNGGGKLFARIYKDPIFQNIHNYNFEHFAKSWRMPYYCCEGTIPDDKLPSQAFIEICPDVAATNLFWKHFDAL